MSVQSRYEDWTLPRLSTPQGLEGFTPWRTCCKVARSKQGITVSLSLTCLNTAVAELTMGSNTPPTDSTDLWVIMHHKSGTAQIWRDSLVSRDLRNFTQTKFKLPGAPTDLLWVKWPPFPIIPNRDSHLRFLTGNPGFTRMVPAISKKVNQLLRQGFTTPARATITWLNQMVLV